MLLLLSCVFLLALVCVCELSITLRLPVMSCMSTINHCLPCCRSFHPGSSLSDFPCSLHFHLYQASCTISAFLEVL